MNINSTCMFKCLYLSMLPINGLKDKIKGFNSVADTQFKHIASKIVGTVYQCLSKCMQVVILRDACYHARCLRFQYGQQ
jgi:hypothetical protein